MNSNIWRDSQLCFSVPLTGEVAFFDVRVFKPTAKRYVNQERRKSYEVGKREKEAI